MDDSDALLAARDVIRERGWARGRFVTPDGRVCLMGALGTALGIEMEGDEAGEGLVEASSYSTLLDTCFAEHSAPVPDVNDFRLSDEDEACDVLELAAKRAAE